jgi:hypothetical protein
MNVTSARQSRIHIKIELRALIDQFLMLKRFNLRCYIIAQGKHSGMKQENLYHVIFDAIFIT